MKKQVRHIGNYFTNSVETSAQEAIYLTLQIPLARATRQVVFINTSPPEKRTFLLKQTSVLEKMSHNSTDIESDNDINRYSKRPEVLANWRLADYISQLEVKYPQKNDTHQDDSDHDNSNRDEYNEGKETEDGIQDEHQRKINITLKNGTSIKTKEVFQGNTIC